MNLISKGKTFCAPPLSEERRRELRLFERDTGARFKKKELLNLAFCHRSFANECPKKIDNNEKLEFLGDSVLGLVVSEYLYAILPEKTEGDLARIKSFVVSEESLAGIAKGIRIDNYILVGKGEEYSGGRKKRALLADCMEAIIGAYFLDSGMKVAKAFVLRYLVGEINKVLEDKHRKDYKTLLQEYIQKRYKSYPKYRLVKKFGPDHDKTFLIEVKMGEKTYGPGRGKNKKEAEQQAASLAFKALQDGEGAEKGNAPGE